MTETEEPRPAPPFRPTELILPVLLVLLVAVGLWWTIARAIRRNEERHPPSGVRPKSAPGSLESGGRRP